LANCYADGRQQTRLRSGVSAMMRIDQRGFTSGSSSGGQMSFGSELKSLLSNIGGAIWPSPTRAKVFLESLGRGVSWALILLLSLAIPLVALSLNSESLGISITADDLMRSIVILAIAASGSLVQLVADGAAFQQATYFLDIGITPSLITLLIGFIAYRAGTRVKEFRNTSDSIRQLAGFSSLGLGLGFAGVLYVASLVGSGSILDFGVVELAPLSALNILWTFFVVSIPALLGALRSGNRKVSSAWRWAYSSIRTFGIFYLVLIGITGLVFLAYSLLAPVFANSLPSLEAAQASDVDVNGWLVLTGIVVVLLFLPALLFNIFAVAMGAEYAYQIDYLGVNLLDLADSFSLLDGISFISSLGGISVLSTLGVWVFLAVVVAVVLASLISGAAATGKASFDPVFRRDLVAGLVSVFFVGFVLRSITQFQAVWTNGGVAAKDATDGSLNLQEGFLTIGVTTASLALMLALMALFMVLGGSKSAGFMQASFPRLVSSLSARTLDSSVEQSIPAIVFGKVVASLAILAVVIPLGIASIERTWAAIDNPGDKFRDVAALVETGELEEVKEFFARGSTDKPNWLPDEVLIAARPSSATRNPIEISNSWDEPWKLGQLDAFGKVSWKGESESVMLNLGTEAEVSDHFRFIQHVNYTATAERLNLAVSYGEFLSAAGRKDIVVNGVSVPVGSYAAIPGTYTVKSPGFILIAASESVVGTDGSGMTFTAKEQPLLPVNAETVLDREADRIAKLCGDFSSLDASRCFSFEEIYVYRTPLGAAPAEDYFAIKTGEFEVIDSKCTGPVKDELLSASSVKRIADCATEMTFEVTYFESKIEVSDVFTTQTYNACPGFAVPCNRSRQVKVGTKETEVIGDRIGRGTMSSTVPFEVEVMGTLKDDGSFEIIDRFVPPVYDITEPEPAEPEAEPVKILGYYKDLEALLRAHPTGSLGDGYVVSKDLDLYVWDGRQWTYVGRR